jgi:hypothetical protein
MQQKWENDKSKVRSAENSFRQKVWSTFLIAQSRFKAVFSYFRNMKLLKNAKWAVKYFENDFVEK